MIKEGNSLWDIYKKVRDDYDAGGDWLLNCEQGNLSMRLLIW